MSVPQTVPDLFQHTRETWLASARITARRLLQRRYTITIEDVLAECPRPSYIHRNTTGSVFNAEMFQPVGFSKALKPSSNGRVIRKWALKEEYVDLPEVDYEV